MNKVILDKVTFGDNSIPLIGGPCVIESRDHCLGMAEKITEITIDQTLRSLPFNKGYIPTKKNTVKKTNPKLLLVLLFTSLLILFSILYFKI